MFLVGNVDCHSADVPVSGGVPEGEFKYPPVMGLAVGRWYRFEHLDGAVTLENLDVIVAQLLRSSGWPHVAGGFAYKLLGGAAEKFVELLVHIHVAAVLILHESYGGAVIDKALEERL